MSLLSFFCPHRWTSHAKEKYEWFEKEIIQGTECNDNPLYQTQQYSRVEEVLICTRCGKIHIIDY